MEPQPSPNSTQVDSKLNATHAEFSSSRDRIQVPVADTNLQSAPSWYAWLEKRFSSRYPGIYRRVGRAAIWVRGPSVKVDLPGKLLLSNSGSSATRLSLTLVPCSEPVPWLQFTIHTSKWSLSSSRTIPLEPWLIRKTEALRSSWLLLVLVAAYIIGLAFFSRAQSFQVPSDSFITCTSTYWTANNGCGLNGQSCAPFNNSAFAFRCPAQCASVVLQNPRTVGNEQIDFKPLIVGGGDDEQTYRGDSFLCAAALQA